MNPWPHQVRAEQKVEAAIARGLRRIVLCARTGAGKTLISCNLIDRWSEQGLRTVLYTNRRFLLEQLSDRLSKHGIGYGIRAAGFDNDELYAPVQLSSMLTEHQRVYRQKRWNLHNAERVIVDEAHMQTGDVARQILADHYAAGAVVIGLTATPIDLADMYDTLLVAGTAQELLDCGALVLAHHYGPDEPDLRRLKFNQGATDEAEEQQAQLTNEQVTSAILRPGLDGRIWHWFEKLNPEHKPTICFGPDLPGSRWIAERFVAKGVTAAHIDGQEVWINGKVYRSSQSAREDCLSASKEGRLCVLCNRFVMREGLDLPWLAHGILATVFGSLQSYLQSGGRLLRAHPSLAHVTIQDHGGNWWRHGSLNEDRVWSLGASAGAMYSLRADRLRGGRERQPHLCPKCSRVLFGAKCACGYERQEGERLVRAVITTDGQMKELSGDVFRPRRVTDRTDGPARWRNMYFRALSPKWNATFTQAEAVFAKENNWGWPCRKWPLMPLSPDAIVRKVADVPTEQLIGDPELLGKVQAYREKHGRL